MAIAALNCGVVFIMRGLDRAMLLLYKVLTFHLLTNNTGMPICFPLDLMLYTYLEQVWICFQTVFFFVVLFVFFSNFCILICFSEYICSNIMVWDHVTINLYHSLGKNSRSQTDIFISVFFLENRLWLFMQIVLETICMKCPSLFISETICKKCQRLFSGG